MMKVGSGFLVAALAILAVGCVSQELGTSDHAIIGGTRSLGVTATVMLVGFPPDRAVMHTCTAAVISPTVLLTAAHCIDAGTHPNYQYGVFTGDDASTYPNLAALEPQLRSVKTVHPHPQYSTSLPFYADIGAVVTSAPLPITPMPMQDTALDTTVIGKAAQIIGYGQIVYDTYNSKRFEAMTTVGGLDNDTIIVGDSAKHACLGDSGGPAIVNGKLVGVDSYGPLGCDGPAHYRRIDSFKPFIEQYVPPATDDPTGDPTEDPTGEDPMTDTEDTGCNASGGAGLPMIGLVGLALGRRRRRALTPAARAATLPP
jgi:uncharacterized protein (TIGR03382 family)